MTQFQEGEVYFLVGAGAFDGRSIPYVLVYRCVASPGRGPLWFRELRYAPEGWTAVDDDVMIGDGSAEVAAAVLVPLKEMPGKLARVAGIAGGRDGQGDAQA